MLVRLLPSEAVSRLPDSPYAKVGLCRCQLTNSVHQKPLAIVHPAPRHRLESSYGLLGSEALPQRVRQRFAR